MGSIVLLASACAPVAYVAQSVGGHLRLVAAARPIPDWLADDSTPPALKQRLLLSQQIRNFAVDELKLPDNASYRRYADIGRSAAVWNVVAAPELSLHLKTWCYPIVGCVGYRGFYDRDDADAAATVLRKQGLEVMVYGVPAYSTLGKLPGDYFADPLLNTFVGYPDVDLAKLVFHELTHQLVYVPGDTVFNESLASTVERIGGERWLDKHGSPGAREAFERSEGRRADFRELTRATRKELEAIYDGVASDERKRTEKGRVMAAMRERYRLLKAQRWDGYSGYDPWMASADNAALGLVAAYNSLVPDFRRIFERDGEDFDRFYADVRRIAALPESQRLQALGSKNF
ncbi:MAG: aminopeptidase [Ideonella sp.]